MSTLQSLSLWCGSVGICLSRFQKLGWSILELGLRRIPILHFICFGQTCVVLSLTQAQAQGIEFAISPRFEDAGAFHEGVAPAKLDGRWGLVDRSGAWAVPPSYDQIRRGNQGRFAALKNKQWGYLSSIGKVVVEPRYDTVTDFRHSYAAVKRSGAWSFIGANGEAIGSFESLTAPENGVAVARKGGKWGVANVSGDFSAFGEGTYYVSSIRSVIDLSHGFYIVQNSDNVSFNCIFEGNSCQYISSKTFKRAQPFSENFAAVAIENPERWSFLRDDGAIMFENRFQAAGDFSQGVAPVKVAGKWGYINRSGAIVVQPTFDAAYTFRNGYAVVRSGQTRGFLQITSSGAITLVVPPQFEDVYAVSEGLAGAKSGGKWGFVRLAASPETVERPIADVSPR